MENSESQMKDSQLMRILDEQPMSSSRAVESDMDEEDDIFLFTHSTLNLLRELWNVNKSILQNFKVVIGFLQFYTLNQGKIDPNTVRMREARVMKDALVSVLDVWKKKRKRGSSTACSLEELNIFLIEEKLLAVLSEDIMMENTFRQWLEEFKGYTSRRPTLRVDATTLKAPSVGDGLNALFNGSTFKEEDTDERLPQYISKLENGRLHTVRTPGEIGHSLIRLDVYEVRDILKRDKREWWKYAKLRTQILTSSSSTDPKQQLVKQFLDLAADDLIGVSGLRKESSNLLH